MLPVAVAVRQSAKIIIYKLFKSIFLMWQNLVTKDRHWVNKYGHHSTGWREMKTYNLLTSNNDLNNQVQANANYDCFHVTEF